MSDYIEREALLERIDGIWDCADMVFEPNDHCCRADDCASCKWAETKKAIRKIVANFPTADARPVVRCKDCKHYEQLDLFLNSPVWSGMCHYWNRHATREDGFCFKAAKMEGSE